MADTLAALLRLVVGPKVSGGPLVRPEASFLRTLCACGPACLARYAAWASARCSSLDCRYEVESFPSTTCRKGKGNTATVKHISIIFPCPLCCGLSWVGSGGVELWSCGPD
jgi:hypothetical protein